MTIPAYTDSERRHLDQAFVEALPPSLNSWPRRHRRAVAVLVAGGLTEADAEKFLRLRSNVNLHQASLVVALREGLVAARSAEGKRAWRACKRKRDRDPLTGRYKKNLQPGDPVDLCFVGQGVGNRPKKTRF